MRIPLSLISSEVGTFVRDFGYGLAPWVVARRPALLVKADVDFILAARTRGELRCYLVETEVGGGLGLVTAAFDDPDEPLTVTTPLLAADVFAEQLATVFDQPTFEIFFFEEHGRERIGVRAISAEGPGFAERLRRTSFPEWNPLSQLDHFHLILKGFGLRGPAQEARALRLVFDEELYPEAATDTEAASLHQEEAGPIQERTIAKLLGRVFPALTIHLNPRRRKEGTEFCDVLVVVDDMVLVVQAKNSPHTPAMLERSIARKRATGLRHVRKAADQLRGSFELLIEQNMVELETELGPLELRLEGRRLFGMVVVREMFEDSRAAWSDIVLAAEDGVDASVNLLGLNELHIQTQNLIEIESFTRGLLALRAAAAEIGSFTRPMF